MSCHTAHHTVTLTVDDPPWLASKLAHEARTRTHFAQHAYTWAFVCLVLALSMGAGTVTCWRSKGGAQPSEELPAPLPRPGLPGSLAKGSTAFSSTQWPPARLVSIRGADDDQRSPDAVTPAPPRADAPQARGQHSAQVLHGPVQLHPSSQQERPPARGGGGRQRRNRVHLGQRRRRPRHALRQLHRHLRRQAHADHFPRGGPHSAA